MRVAVTGSRGICDYDLICGYLDKVLQNILDFTIVTGGYTDVDKMAYKYALTRGYSHEEIVPDWEKHGRSAFYQRNLKLIDCDKAVIFWDGKSKGTSQFIHRCKRYGVDYRLKILRI